MNINNYMRFVIKSCTLLLILSISLLSQAVEIDGKKFEVNQLNDNVYVVSQDYGSVMINFGLVIGNDYAILITAMMKNSAPTVYKLIKGLTKKPLRYVFNIDSDPFQHSANAYFSMKGATIVSQKNLSNTEAFTELTFDQELTLNLGNDTLKSYYIPSHTLSSSIIHLEGSNVLFMGDAFRNDWLMYSGPNGADAHLRGLEFAIQLSDSNTQIIPGNRSKNFSSDINGLVKAYDIYKAFSKRVKQLDMQGVTAQNISLDESIHDISNKLERYSDWKNNMIYHVNDVLSYTRSASKK